MMLKITKLETEKELEIICSQMTWVEKCLWWTLLPINLSVCALGFWFNHAYCGSSIIFNLICGFGSFIWLLAIQNLGKGTIVDSKEELIKMIEKF